MAENSLDLFADSAEDQSALDLFAPKRATSTISGKDILKPRLEPSGMHTAMEFINSRDRGIDYFTGVQTAGFRSGFSKADNEKERVNFLNKNVGKENWGKDSFGAIVIKPRGLKKLGVDSPIPIAMDEQGASLSDIADMRGAAPAIAGAITATMLTGGLATLPSIGLVMLGGAGGKGIGEAIEAASGENIQTPGEVFKDISLAGLESGIGEGIYRGLFAPVGRWVMAPQAKRMTDETRKLVDMAADIGVQPNISQITKAPILGRTQSMINRIFGGDPLTIPNTKALLQEAEKLKVLSGEVSKKSADIGKAVSVDIKAKRATFSETIGKVYADVDTVLQGQAVVPTRALKHQASSLLDDLPKAADGKPVFTSPEMRKTIEDALSMPEHVTAKQMQAVRNVLYDASQSGNLVPGMSARNARDLWKATSESFDDALKVIKSNPSGKQTERALLELKRANSIYSKGIAKFDDNLIASITKDPSKAGAIDPDLLVQAVFKKNSPMRVAKVRKLVSDETWDLVKRKAMGDILKKMASRTDDPRVSIFNGKGLLDSLDSYGKETLVEMFGKDLTNNLYRFGEVMQFSTQKMGMSGGLVAANIALHPLANLGLLAKLNIMNRFMNSKMGIKWLTEGVKAPKTRAGVASITRAALLMAMLADQETGVAKINLVAPPSPEVLETVAENPLTGE